MNAFNHEGILRCPKLIDTVSDPEGKVYPIPDMATSRALSTKAASQTKAMLVKAVEEGYSFRKARYPGLEVGGMGAAAYIAKDGRYVREYRSSFYGFANDTRGNGYTIGVLVIRPKAKGQFYVSRSAVPVFGAIVGMLAEHGWLHPEDLPSNE